MRRTSRWLFMTYRLAASAFLILLSAFILTSTPSVYAQLPDLHLSLVWLGGEKSTDYARIPMENETFFVHAYVMSEGFLGSAANASVNVNLDNYTRQEEVLSLNPSDPGGVASFGPFKANRGTHTVRIEVNPDRRIIENNYVDNVKVLTFSVFAEVKDHAIEPAVVTPIWNYSRTAEISLHIGVGNYKKPNSFLAAASSDGHVIAVGSNEGTLILFDEAGVTKWTHDFGAGYGAVYALSVSHNGEFVAVGSVSMESDVGNIYLFASNGTLLFKKGAKGFESPDVSVTDSGDVLSAGRTVTLYDKFGHTKWESRPFPEEIFEKWYNAWYQQLKPAATNKPISIMEADSAAISADGSLAVIGTGGYDFYYALGHYGVYFLDGRTGRSLWNYTEANSGYYYFSRVFVSPDGSVVVASNQGGNTYVFNRQGTGASLSWTLTLNSRDIYGYSDDVYPYWGDVLPAATRGNLVAVAVNYVWTGYVETSSTSVTGYEERAPYGAYLFDKAGTLVARLVGLGNGVISSIALTDSLLVLGSVGRVSVYSMSEIAQQAMLEATGAIEKARLSGANVQAAEQSLNTAKSTAFWFDAYLHAKQATSFALQSESQTKTEVTQTSSLSQMTFTAMFGTQQVIASNVTMILLASEPGGCHVQSFPFSATKGEQIFVQFGTNGPVNFFFMTEAAYQTWSKTGSCDQVSGAILNQHSVKEFDQGLEPIIVPADGNYEFLFMNTASSPVAVTFHSDMTILPITSTRSEVASTQSVVSNQQSSIVTEAAAGLIVVTAVVAISVILSRRRMASRSSHRSL